VGACIFICAGRTDFIALSPCVLNRFHLVEHRLKATLQTDTKHHRTINRIYLLILEG